MMQPIAINGVDRFLYRHYRMIHGVRIALSFIFTFLLARILDLPEMTWILITLVVIMGPVSFLGNVVLRAGQRILGTVAGAISGLLGLYIELYSFWLMLLWCGVVMFGCGYFTLGKRPYAGLLIGITLAVVLGAPAGDFHTAIWRTLDVIIGAILALCCVYVMPQRASIHWRILFSENMRLFSQVVENAVQIPSVDCLKRQQWQQQIVANLKKMEGLSCATAKEMGFDLVPFNQVQQLLSSLVILLELIGDSLSESRQMDDLALEESEVLIQIESLVSLFNRLALQSIEGGEHSDKISSRPEYTILMRSPPVNTTPLERVQVSLAMNSSRWLFYRLHQKSYDLQQVLQVIWQQV